jgi:small-conductance mechanosensitive channel
MPAVLSDIGNSIGQFWHNNQNEAWVHWIEGLLLFAGIFLASGLVRRYVRKELQRTHVDAQVVILVTRLAWLGGLILAVIAFFSVALNNTALVFGSFGVFALAFGLAFQDILKNFIAGVFLLLERPFRIGTRSRPTPIPGRSRTSRCAPPHSARRTGSRCSSPTRWSTPARS